MGSQPVLFFWLGSSGGCHCRAVYALLVEVHVANLVGRSGVGGGFVVALPQEPRKPEANPAARVDAALAVGALVGRAQGQVGAADFPGFHCFEVHVRLQRVPQLVLLGPRRARREGMRLEKKTKKK